MSGRLNIAVGLPPLLSSRKAAELADCDRSTLQRALKRAGIAPAGKRGRTLFYATQDILDWLAAGLERDVAAPAPTPVIARPSSAPTNELALARLARLTKGGRR